MPVVLVDIRTGEDSSGAEQRRELVDRRGHAVLLRAGEGRPALLEEGTDTFDEIARCRRLGLEAFLDCELGFEVVLVRDIESAFGEADGARSSRQTTRQLGRGRGQLGIRNDEVHNTELE